MTRLDRPPRLRVTLLTDFGTVDGYVAAMKGVLASRVEGVVLDDVTHDIPQGDVRAAARTLGRFWRLYPPRTVHLVVVDPGVGTARRALAVEADGRFVVAPDNGVVSPVILGSERWTAVEIERVDPPTDEPSSTFHGRDVFGPAAAHLASGGGLDALGTEVSDPSIFEPPSPSRGTVEGGWSGEVVAVDHFGNLVTNLPGRALGPASVVRVGGSGVPVAKSYGHVAKGEAVAVVGSDGVVEIAVRDGSATRLLGLEVGASVELLPGKPGGHSPSSQRRSASER